MSDEDSNQNPPEGGVPEEAAEKPAQETLGDVIGEVTDEMMGVETSDGPKDVEAIYDVPVQSRSL